MAIHDPVANMLTIIRNGVRAGLKKVSIPKSKLSTEILKVLKKENYIYEFKQGEEESRSIIVYLNAPASAEGIEVKKITRIDRVSRPGLRKYVAVNEIPNILNGIGMCVISTSKGVISGKTAKKEKVGGEVLLKVW